MGNGDTVLARGDDAEGAVYVESGLLTALASITIQNDVGHSPVVTSGFQIQAASFSKTAGRTNVYEAAYVGGDFAVWHGSIGLTEASDVADCDATSDSYFDDDAGTLYVNVGGGAPSTIYVVKNATPILTVNGVGLTWDGINCQWGGAAFKFNAAGIISNTIIQYWTCPTITNICIDIGLGSDGMVLHDSAIIVTLGYPFRNNGLNTTIYNIVSTENAELTSGMGFNIYDSTLDSISIKGNSSGTIHHCHFIRGGHHHIATTYAHTGTITIHHCLCTYPVGASDPVCHGIVNHSAGVTNLYHNVVAYLNRNSTGSEEAYYIDADGDITMRNNVAYECRIGIIKAGAKSPTLDLDYTGFYGNPVADYSGVAGGDQGTHDVTLLPRFVDALNDDFRLRGGSPYIDAGVHVPGIDDDYNGSAPDIGRYEFARRHGGTPMRMFGAWR
jgi:hypothetical protein